MKNNTHFHELKNIERREVVPGCFARFVHSQNMTFAYWDLLSGAELPEHSHPHEQVATIIEGELELTIDGEKKLFVPGQMAIIPSNAKHNVKALKASYVLDVFYPIREDYQ